MKLSEQVVKLKAENKRLKEEADKNKLAANQMEGIMSSALLCSDDLEPHLQLAKKDAENKRLKAEISWLRSYFCEAHQPLKGEYKSKEVPPCATCLAVEQNDKVKRLEEALEKQQNALRWAGKTCHEGHPAYPCIPEQCPVHRLGFCVRKALKGDKK